MEMGPENDENTNAQLQELVPNKYHISESNRISGHKTTTHWNSKYK